MRRLKNISPTAKTPSSLVVSAKQFFSFQNWPYKYNMYNFWMCPVIKTRARVLNWNHNFQIYAFIYVVDILVDWNITCEFSFSKFICMISRRELFYSWEVRVWKWKEPHGNVIKRNSNAHVFNIPCTWYVYVSFLFWWMDCSILLNQKVSSYLLLLFLPANEVMRLIELSLIQIPSIIWSPIAWVWKPMWKLKLPCRRDFGLGCLCYGGNTWAAPQLWPAVRNRCQVGS